ncbi:MAG: phosphate/phosphite/phosphonate ABC transporter substrate-binding protein, partial [Deltaproteobacteria bacterium]|nr:phosphate/phosphite/phosphonate ABC transporter substrate-binding protein [Deltaproteobacteria bacterium]
MNRTWALTIAVLLAIAFAGCAQQPQVVVAPTPTPEPPLRVAFIPGGDPDLEMKLFGDIMKNVADQIGRPIELQTATSYATVVEGLREGHLDMARMGPFIYVLARQKGIPVEPIVIEDLKGKGTSYKAILIARTDRNIEFSWDPAVTSKLSVGLVEEGSTSGSVIPQAEGMNYDPPITLDSWREVAWTGSHNASIAAVQEGHVDVAFVADRRLIAALASNVVAEGEIEILWESGPITNSPFVAHQDLGLETFTKLEWAFR